MNREFHVSGQITLLAPNSTDSHPRVRIHGEDTYGNPVEEIVPLNDDGTYISRKRFWVASVALLEPEKGR